MSCFLLWPPGNAGSLGDSGKPQGHAVEPAHTRAACTRAQGLQKARGLRLQGTLAVGPIRDREEARGLQQRRCRHGEASPPALELVSQLVQDLHGLSVVVQLRIHQGRELAHLLNLWDQQGWRDTTVVAVSPLTPTPREVWGGLLACGSGQAAALKPALSPGVPGTGGAALAPAMSPHPPTPRAARSHGRAQRGAATHIGLQEVVHAGLCHLLGLLKLLHGLA